MLYLIKNSIFKRGDSLVITFLLTLIETDEDKEFLILIYDKYAKMLNLIAKNNLDNIADIDDCIQETFVEIIKSFDSFKKVNPSHQKSYISTVCRRTAYKINSKNLKTISFEDLQSAYLKTENLNFSEFNKIEIAYSLNKLDLKYREPIIMKYMDGLPVKEISEKLGISENLVLQRIYRAKKLLYDLLMEE